MAKVLIIDDKSSDCLSIKSILKKDNHEIVSITDGIYAVQEAKNFLPDMIILDLCLKDCSGIDICYDLRAMPELKDIIILFLTASDDIESIQEAFRAGANDYTIKPIHSYLFLHRVRTMLSELENKKQVKKMNKKYTSIVNTLPDLVWTVNEDNVVTAMHIPAEFATLLPNEDDYVGKHIGEYLPEELTKMCVDSIKKARETNKVVTIFYPLDVHDNLTWEDSRFIKINEDVLCVTRDMTNLIETKIDLNNALAKLQALVNSIPDPIWIADRNGYILEQYNLPHGSKNCIGLHVKKTFDKKASKALLDAIERSFESQQLQEFSYENDAAEIHDFRVVRIDHERALITKREVTYLCKPKTYMDKAFAAIEESQLLINEIRSEMSKSKL